VMFEAGDMDCWAAWNLNLIGIAPHWNLWDERSTPLLEWERRSRSSRFDVQSCNTVCWEHMCESVRVLEDIDVVSIIFRCYAYKFNTSECDMSSGSW
jgi:hypothetical protein